MKNKNDAEFIEKLKRLVDRKSINYDKPANDLNRDYDKIADFFRGFKK